jgi:hypothetical protein
MSFCSTIYSQNALEALSKTTGIARDEMFTFKVTYSNVKILKGNLCFTQHMIHKESLGTLKITMKCRVPLKAIMEADRAFIAENGIGRNPVVSIKMRDGSFPFELEIERETKDGNGKLIKPVETNKTKSSFWTINFSTAKDAEKWNDKFTEFLEDYKKSKKKKTKSTTTKTPNQQSKPHQDQ